MIKQSNSDDFRDIKLENPSEEELCAWWQASGLPLKKFFNTSGLQYKALQLKDKLPTMTEDEMLALAQGAIRVLCGKEEAKVY